MKNFVQPGKVLDFVAPAGGVISGNGYLIGAVFVVANTSAAEGELFAGERMGVFTLPKTTSQSWAQGAALYWDDTTKKLTTTVGSNTKVGAVAVAGLAADAVGTALIAGIV